MASEPRGCPVRVVEQQGRVQTRDHCVLEAPGHLSFWEGSNHSATEMVVVEAGPGFGRMSIVALPGVERLGIKAEAVTVGQHVLSGQATGLHADAGGQQILMQICCGEVLEGGDGRSDGFLGLFDHAFPGSTALRRFEKLTEFQGHQGR